MSRFRMVLTGDWHLDARTGGVERREEIERAVMEGPVRAAVEGKAELFAFLGDLCDPGGRSAVHDCAFPIKVADELNEGGVPSVWVAGNHDVVLCDERRTTLDPVDAARIKYRVAVPGRCPCVLVVGVMRVLMLPYSHREADWDITGSALVEASRPDKALVVLGHCTSFPTALAEGGSEAVEFSRGRGRPWPELPRVPLFAANGHYHNPQDIDLGGYKVHVPGSLVRLTFGDADSRRGFSVVDLEV